MVWMSFNRSPIGFRSFRIPIVFRVRMSGFSLKSHSYFSLGGSIVFFSEKFLELSIWFVLGKFEPVSDKVYCSGVEIFTVGVNKFRKLFS